MKPKPHASNLRKGRHSQPGLVYFITTDVDEREPLIDTHWRDLIISTFKWLRDHERIWLLGYVIMDNHFHVMFMLREGFDLAKVMQSVKRQTSREINKLRGVEGQFWLEGYHDHLVRDARDFWNHFHYIHNNPVKRGWVKKAEGYPWSTAYPSRKDDVDWKVIEPLGWGQEEKAESQQTIGIGNPSYAMPFAPTDLVLVCLMPSKRDLEIARVLGWYRIPYTKAPKTVSVDALAFYQTAKFGDEKWSINYIAPVVGHELTTRGELLRTEKDHPHANEQYFKIQIGSLERLAKPIPSRSWRRITFFYTTGERLLNANEINDLIVDSEERELLWTALKERGLTAERKYEVKRGIELDFALMCQLGVLGVMLGEEKKIKEQSKFKYVAIPEVQVKNDLPNVLKKVEQAVKKLGGLHHERHHSAKAK